MYRGINGKGGSTCAGKPVTAVLFCAVSEITLQRMSSDADYIGESAVFLD